MARKKSTRARKRRFGPRIAAALLLALALLMGYGALNANTVRLRRAEVYVPDLPAGFEGVTMLYLSDIDLCGLNTAEKSAALVNRLQALRPDLLLLGGDYTSPSLWELLNRTEGEADWLTRRDAARAAFFRGVSGFEAPLGKYALASPDDGDIKALVESWGFVSISDAAVTLRQNGGELRLAGLSSEGGAPGLLMGGEKADCVIVAAYSPACFPLLMTLEAPGGGALADLALAGHTHGGQIRLMGRTAIALTSQERQYLSGWNREGPVPLLTTTGLGCEGLNIRYGAAPEAWLIKLTGVRP